MKKSATKNVSINRVKIEYKLMRRYKVRVYNARNELPEDAQHMPSFNARPDDSCFPIIWLDYESLTNRFPNNDFWEYIEIDDDVLIDLTDSQLASGGFKSASIAAGLANKYGFLGVEYARDDRGEPVEVWVALSKGLSLIIEVKDELDNDCRPAEIRRLLESFGEIASVHWYGIASQPYSSYEPLKTAKDDELESLARQVIIEWVKNLIPRTLPNLQKDFELETSVVDGEFRSRILARAFIVALAFFLGRYLEGGSSVRKCKNDTCKRWFTKQRKNDEYGGIDSKGKSQCRVNKLRSKPCPYARERLKS